ncbi:hypothetical protein [Janthinobacterium agaricidamnosum]|uniref:Uncharacterized protein n=1 Tax=Janthinobacterium agaricidamnosum NBRC 102515 = DSM 9628 TaxID=1349767 RepID=W0VAL7_9BURK|nr:hypothetical protein [Janthinobacterium agaricidamnosum]CDG84317.1 hypothetical protein GJA_3702 [Janthinobacterium agaricidamnosum NBRC 102515 = DSM 9628]
MSGAVLIDMSQARAGMVLAGPLHDSGGGILLPAGATLSDSNIQSLLRRGIEVCCVAEREPPQDEAALRLRRQYHMQRLERLFRHSIAASGGADRDDDASGLLLQLLRNYRNTCQEHR